MTMLIENSPNHLGPGVEEHVVTKGGGPIRHG